MMRNPVWAGPGLRVHLIVILTVAMLSPVFGSSGGHRWTRNLASGITLTQMIEACPQSGSKCAPQFINSLTIDPTLPGVKVKTILAQDRVMGDDPTRGRETVSSMVKRSGAVAGVNGDYHNWIGDPDNLFILNGELVSEPWSRRPVFGVRSSGTFVFDKIDFDARVTAGGESYTITGINRQPDGDELVIYTPRYFRSTMTKPKRREAVIEVDSGLPARAGVPIVGRVKSMQAGQGNTPIQPGTVVLSGIVKSGRFVADHLKPGAAVRIEMNLKPRETADWSDVLYAVGGCPWIVRNGRFWMDAAEEHVEPGFYDVPNPRTAVGQTADGKLVIVTVDGRQSTSGGMKLSQLAAVMISMGCVEAINLDGGGSTDMSVSSGVLNSPSDGNERATATCLAVFGRPKLCRQTPDFHISGNPKKITSGATCQLTLTDSTGAPLSPELLRQAVWTTDGGIGFVDQSGVFHALKAHKGTITASLGDNTAGADVEVLPGPFSRITVRLDPIDGRPENIQRLRVWIRDANANPVRFQKFTVAVTSGTAERTELQTNDDGIASVVVTWNDSGKDKCEVEIECGDWKTVLSPPE